MVLLRSLVAQFSRKTLNQPCPTRGLDKEFVRSSIGFRCRRSANGQPGGLIQLSTLHNEGEQGIDLQIFL